MHKIIRTTTIGVLIVFAMAYSSVYADKIILEPLADNWISSCSSGSLINNGTHLDMRVRTSWYGNPGEVKNFRTLLRFCESCIPSDMQVADIKLALYYYTTHNGDPAGRIYNVHKVTNNWQETGSAWQVRENFGLPGSELYWEAYTLGVPSYLPGGGDYSPEIESSAIVPSSTGEWMHWDVKSLFSSWQDGTHANHGLLLKDSAEFTGDPGQSWISYMAQFRSREYSLEQFRPHLQIGLMNGIGDIKQVSPGTKVLLEAKTVTADFTYPFDKIYVKDTNGANAIGIKVNGAGFMYFPGDIISVTGTIALWDNSELGIEACDIVTEASGDSPHPEALPNKQIGGFSHAEQPATVDGAGLNTVGRYVRTTGEITGVYEDFSMPDGNIVDLIWIDDGSNRKDGLQYANENDAKGLAVIVPDGLTTPSSGYLTVTGVVMAIDGPLGPVPIIAATEMYTH